MITLSAVPTPTRGLVESGWKHTQPISLKGPMSCFRVLLGVSHIFTRPSGVDTAAKHPLGENRNMFGFDHVEIGIGIRTSTNARKGIPLTKSTMKIAVEGCLHGELDAVYNILLQRERREGIKIDLLICCGDFQAVRNGEDMRWMKVPDKYKTMGTFYKYYSGELSAPMLTVFVGGNHEASNHLTELAYGGWVAPNIYYLGYSGVVRFGGLRIAGVSGIYNHHHYHLGHFERPPFNKSMLTSAYHVRSFEVFKLKQVSGKIDIFVSHDWPVEIYHHGDTEGLLRWKSYFRKEVETNTLGSPAGKELLDHLKPLRWWAGHLHCRFEAKYVHKITEEPLRSTKSSTTSEDTPTAPTIPTSVAEVTEFLALDKCLPKRQFLEVFEFPEPPCPKVLCYDHQWLAITKAVNQLMPLDRLPWQPPFQAGSDRASLVPTEDDMKEIHEIFKGDFTIPQNFQMSVRPFNPMSPWQQGDGVVEDNPQTVEFCSKLKIRNNFSCKLTDCDYQTPKVSNSVKQVNPDEIVIDDEEDDEEYNTGTSQQTSLSQTTPSSDPLDDKNRKEIEPEQKRKKEM